MDPYALWIAAMIILPAIGLVIWALFSVAKVDTELRAFSGFERAHFDIGLQALASAEGAAWPNSVDPEANPIRRR